MPRLSHNHFRQQHLAIRAEWLRGAYAFVVLTPTEQIAIHAFYEPSLDLSDKQLREHRTRVTLEQPSLPHRAGKAHAKIAPFIGYEHPPMLGGTSLVRRGQRKGERRRVTVWGEVNPHIDPEQIAKILLDMMNEQRGRERAE